MSQQGYGLGGIFRSAGPIFRDVGREAGKIGVVAGADLLKGLLGDVIEGKSVKESARERGRQAGKQSLNLAGERAKQAIQAPKATPKATKRPSSQSVGPKKKKAKKSQKGGRKKSQKGGHKKSQKRGRKKSQKGGFVHYLLEKYGRKHKRAQEGGRKRKKSQKKAVGVVFPRAMTSKQRKSLPMKDIFG